MSFSASLSGSDVEWTVYEFPFTERIRTLLRLEDLFDKFDFFLSHDHPLHHHAAIMTMFEIMEVGARADLKSDLLQEMERQRQSLNGLREHPGIDLAALTGILADLEKGTADLGALNGRLGQHLRENEWLMAIRSRTSIPGGVCEFDLPGYYAWQQKPADLRRSDIYTWAKPMAPLMFAIRIVLKLLRESGQVVLATATGGSFTQPMSGKTYQLLQIRLPRGSEAIPEFSANKYMLWVRFNQPTLGQEAKNKPVEADLDFQFKLCSL